MKSKLALLDEMVLETVALELGKSNHDNATLVSLGVATQRFREVAGLRIVSNAARDEEVDSKSAERLDRLLRFCNDAELVRKKLARAGVKPLAVLPKTAWLRICEKAGLYRFKPKDGKVFINVGGVDAIFTTALEQVRAEAKAKLNLKDSTMWKILDTVAFFLWIVGFVGIGIFSNIYEIPKNPEVFMFLAWFLVGGFTWAIISLPDQMPSDNELKPLVADRIRSIVDKHKKDDTLVQTLWPERCEWARDSLQVKVAFPDPPKDVQERIALAERARLPINLAVTPDAVTFLEDPTAVILKEEQRRWDDQLLRLKADPIAYVIECSAVAIIDQYGDFPIEKEVINEVINSEYLV